MPTRDELRAQIFNSTNTKPKSKEIDFFGVKIEIRQLDLGMVLDFRTSENTRKEQMVDTIIAYAFVPNSDEHVFEVADRDQLLSMPFGPDYQRLQAAITELTGVDLQTKEAEKNSAATG